MIDLMDETVVSLRDALKRLPKTCNGKCPHIATIYRWVQRGIRGVKLETLRVGGTVCTSQEALQRFFDRCTDPSIPPSPTTKRQRQREISKAAKELDDAGI